MVEEGFKRKLTAILSADVEGYSRLMADDETATVKTIASYREIMTSLIKQHRGRVVDSPGDNLLAEFSSVVDAVQCAVAVQNEIQTRNTELPDFRRMEFRIGINLGDVIDEEDRIYGNGVNIAARLESLADPGGICVSKTAFDQIETKLPLGYEYLGEQSVKNIPKPIGAYRVLMKPDAAGKVIGEKRFLGRYSRRTAMAAIIILLMIAVGLVSWNIYLQQSKKVEPASIEKMAFPLPDRPSIAVLPFNNLSGDQSQEYIADGLSENIISSLSKIPELLVIARNSTFVYKGKAVKINQVAEDLGVKYVLEGSVQSSGENLRVTAQLIDALKGHHLWSERYDRATKDFFTVQDDITRNIVFALDVELGEGEQARLRYTTENLEAWGYATKGNALFEQFTKEKNAKARELFKQAAKLDPNYAFAWIALAWTHYIDFRYGFSTSRGESLKRCVELTKKVANLDDSLPEVHSTWMIIYLAQGQYDKAITAGKQAINLGPSDAYIHVLLSMTLHFAGKFEEAIFHAKEAMRLDPYHPNYYLGHLANSYSMVEKHEKAIAHLKKMIERAREEGSQLIPAQVYLVNSYVGTGQMEEAKALAAEIIELDPNFSLKNWQKSRFYKDPADLDRILNALRKAGLPDTPPLPLLDKPSIAVLAFENMSGDPEQEYFSDGLSEEIITALSKTPKLLVIARNSSFAYKGKPVKVQQVGRELGVKYVLEGSVRKSGDRVRITAQLVDTMTGNHLWADRYDRDLKDIFALQDEITTRIITELRVKLTEGEQARLLYKGTENLQAYLKYLQGLEYILTQTKENNDLARGLAEEVIAIDPEFPQAYTLLGATYWMELYLGSSKSPKLLLKKAIELNKKAIALNDFIPKSHSHMGWLYVLTGKHADAIAECKRAISIAPNSADAHHWMAYALRYAGRHEEAVRSAQHALRLNPIPPSPYYRSLGLTYLFVGKYEEAIAAFKKSLDRSPNDILTHLSLACVYSLANRNEDAQAEAQKVLQINPNFSLKHLAKRLTYKNQTDKELIVSAAKKAGLPE